MLPTLRYPSACERVMWQTQLMRTISNQLMSCILSFSYAENSG